MIVPADEDYRATKLLKTRGRSVEGPLGELASWIQETWGLRPLNVIYDPRNSLHAPRINVVFEFKAEADHFHDGVNFDRDKQAAISARFHMLADAQPHGFDLQGLFVIFNAFAPVAVLEANGRVSQQEVHELQLRLADPALWCIHRCFSSVTFMFYTDLQRAKRERDGSKVAYAQAYLAILKPYDEFGYLNADDYSVRLDSKENFKRNYAENWFYYDR